MGTIGAVAVYADVSAETVTFYRLFIGAVLMGFFLLLTGQKDKIFTWSGIKVLVTGAFLACFVVFYVMALNYTGMANAVMLLYLAPVTASTVAHFFMGERLSGLSAALIGVALFGFAMMMEFNFNLTGRKEESIGLFYALCAMLCYAAFMLTNRLIHERVHVLTRSGFQMLVVAAKLTLGCGRASGGSGLGSTIDIAVDDGRTIADSEGQLCGSSIKRILWLLVQQR